MSKENWFLYNYSWKQLSIVVNLVEGSIENTMKLILLTLLAYFTKSSKSLPEQRFLIEFAIKHGRKDVIIHKSQGLNQQFKKWIIDYHHLSKRSD